MVSLTQSLPLGLGDALSTAPASPQRRRERMLPSGLASCEFQCGKPAVDRRVSARSRFLEGRPLLCAVRFAHAGFSILHNGFKRSCPVGHAVFHAPLGDVEAIMSSNRIIQLISENLLNFFGAIFFCGFKFFVACVHCRFLFMSGFGPVRWAGLPLESKIHLSGRGSRCFVRKEQKRFNAEAGRIADQGENA